MENNVFQLIEEEFSEDIKLKLTVKDGLVFIDGSGKSLKWLAKVMDAYAGQDFEDDFWITPKGPGSVYFSKGSTHGIYLYNTDFKKKRKNK